MRGLSIPIVIWLAFTAGCAARTNKPVGTAGTLAELRNVRPDVQEVKVEQGLEQAMQNYRRFLEETPETTMTPEAMRRLADLQLEKQLVIRANPNSGHFDEVQLRRGEYFFTRRKFRDAENAYSAIVTLGAKSSYYGLALYKLGWTFYKQEFYEEALQKYIALLDYKVKIG